MIVLSATTGDYRFKDARSLVVCLFIVGSVELQYDCQFVLRSLYDWRFRECQLHSTSVTVTSWDAFAPHIKPTLQVWWLLYNKGDWPWHVRRLQG